MPNPSDASFIAALDEYMDGNYEKAAQFIENGVIKLRDKSRILAGKVKDSDKNLDKNLREQTKKNRGFPSKI